MFDITMCIAMCLNIALRTYMCVCRCHTYVVTYLFSDLVYMYFFLSNEQTKIYICMYLRTDRINFISFLDCLKNIETFGMLSNCSQFISKDVYLITVTQILLKGSLLDKYVIMMSAGCDISFYFIILLCQSTFLTSL